ncbi:MAG TPA: nitroreductase family protein [Candidatus Krumholzibacteria bacterium]|nr:nitroreductase family protein [Candidatus Krumholzibacteria bacterium]HPD72455.1 nitroreductase family protein [Candidatus Krumholzibacteria bacterium]HRY40613.1 nitroreductase family protein [Candidatus Krumholzibacteria bacterium]
MDALAAIFTRRSIRHYTAEPIRDELVETLLRAGMAAPSAGNQQAWEFMVVDDRRVLDAIPEIHPYAQMCREAPLCLAVCADLSRERYAGFWVQDCSATTQNILLAAHSLGLGAVWLGIMPGGDRARRVAQLLGLPAGVEPLSLVAVGHPAETKPAEDRFDPGKVHRNAW